MPTLSSFHGIVIAMYHADHAPHFHAEYGEYEASFWLSPLAIAAGQLPSRVERMVLEWAALHRDERDANWQRAMDLQPLRPIAPLP